MALSNVDNDKDIILSTFYKLNNLTSGEVKSEVIYSAQFGRKGAAQGVDHHRVRKNLYK